MKRAAAESVTVRLTSALLADFEGVAVNAVNSKDMASLVALHEMRVDLAPALTQSVRCGFHEITRGLRLLGVPVSEYQVDWAVSKSPESYWYLCGEEAAPVFPEVALEIALREAKFPFAHLLLERWNVPVTARAILQLRSPKKSVPRELIEKLFARLSDADLSAAVQICAAQYATPAIIDRIVRVAKDCDVHHLAAIAMKAENAPVAQELLSRLLTIDPSMVSHFSEACYLVGLDQRRNDIDIAFLQTLHRHGAQFRLADITPLLDDFLLRNVGPLGINASDRDKVQGREFFKWIVSVVGPEDRGQLPDFAEPRSFTVPRLPPDWRQQVAAEWRAALSAAEVPPTIEEFPNAGL